MPGLPKGKTYECERFASCSPFGAIPARPPRMGCTQRMANHAFWFCCLPTCSNLHFPNMATKCCAPLTPHWQCQVSHPMLFGYVRRATWFGTLVGATGTTVNFTDDPPDPLKLLSGRPPDRPILGSGRGRATAELGSSHRRAHGIWGTGRVKLLFWERDWQGFGQNTWLKFGFARLQTGIKLPWDPGSQASSMRGTGLQIFPLADFLLPPLLSESLMDNRCCRR